MSDQRPTSVKDAIPYMLSLLDEESRAQLKAIPRHELIQLHRGYGMGLRNDLGLWGQNQALINDPELKGLFPDDMSMILIEKLWDYLHAQDGDTAN